MASVETVKKVMKWTLLALVVVFALVYGADYALVRVRASGVGGSPFGRATVYYATTLKNGKVELYYQNPMSVSCVNSLFPHLGYSTCWALHETPVKDVE